jgi:hypothetical protein
MAPPGQPDRELPALPVPGEHRDLDRDPHVGSETSARGWAKHGAPNVICHAECRPSRGFGLSPPYDRCAEENAGCRSFDEQSDPNRSQKTAHKSFEPEKKLLVPIERGKGSHFGGYDGFEHGVVERPR